MTARTRETLKYIHDLLHEAGWDAPPPPPPTGPPLEALREVYARTAQPDDLAVLNAGLAGTAEPAAVAAALGRLRRFTEQAEELMTAAGR